MISIEDIKLLLKVKNITVSLTDDELLRYIELARNELYAILGIDSEISEHTYTIYFKNYHKHITLPLSNVLEVISVKKNGKLISSSNYDVDLSNGIIHMFHPHKHFNTTLTIEYSTVLPDYLVQNIDSLLTELVVDGLTPTSSIEGKGVKKIDEGDVTVEYEDSSSDYNLGKKIADMKKQINDYLYHDTVMMIS